MTRNLMAMALVAFLGCPAVVRADPGFKALQVDLMCGDALACKSYNKWVHTRVTWSNGAGAVLYVEDGTSWIDHGDMGSITLYLDGNGNAANFNRMYADPATNILNAPGLTITVEADKKNLNLFEFVMKRDFRPVPWAVWALHSGDTAGLQSQIDANRSSIDSVRSSSDAAYLAEVAARKQSDLDTLASAKAYTDSQVTSVKTASDAKANDAKVYTDTQISAETARAQSAEAALSSAINNEATARSSGDAATLANAKSYTDASVTSEATARSAGDAQTLTSAKSYTDASVTSESTRAQAAEGSLSAAIAAESQARLAGDAQVLTNAQSYTDGRVAAETARAQAAESALQSSLETVSSDLASLTALVDGMSVTATAPITSTGGRNPVIGLAACAEGQVYAMVKGAWACTTPGGGGGGNAQRGVALYANNHPACGGVMGAVTTAATCSYDPGAGHNTWPTCEQGCSFTEIQKNPMCMRTCVDCEGFGCREYCCPDEMGWAYFGTCDCTNQALGFTLQ